VITTPPKLLPGEPRYWECLSPFALMRLRQHLASQSPEQLRAEREEETRGTYER
jgi:hypothetical protein